MSDLEPCATSGALVKHFVTDKTGGSPVEPIWTDDFNTSTAAAGALQQILQGNTVKRIKNREQLQGSTGSVQWHASTNNHVANTVAGSISKRISALDAAFYIPKILSMDEFHLLKIISDIERYEYRWLKILQATLSGSEGGSVNLAMNVAGKEFRDEVEDQDGDTSNTAEADPDSSLAGIGLTEIYKPLLFGEFIITDGTDTFCADNISVGINNGATAKRYNSKNVKCIRPGRRTVTVQLGVPYNSDLKDYWKNNNDASIDITLQLRKFTNEAQTNYIGFDITLRNLIHPDDEPNVIGDDDIGYLINAQAFTDGITDDITFSAVDIVTTS